MKQNATSTRDLIFEASVGLFSTKGFNGTSIRDIATRVGIKESSIYNHYKGKRAILDSILSFYIESFHSALPNRDEMDDFASQFSDPGELWVQGIFDFIHRLPPIWNNISLILLNEMFLDEKCRRFVQNTLFTAQRETTEMLLQDLYHRGMIEKNDFKALSRQYVYMMHGMDIENRLRLLQGESPDLIKKEMVSLMKQFIKGLQGKAK